MNTYICHYNRKEIEVEAATSYAAQQEAVKRLTVGRKVPKGYEISVQLAAKDGVPVVHSTAEF